MPSITRTTSSPSFPNGYNVTTLTSLLTAIEASMAEGLPITAFDFNNLITVYNIWRNHTHSVTDLSFEAFGSSPSGTTTSVTRTTDPTALAELALVITAGQSITATHTNSMVTSINGTRTHNHALEDADT